MQLPLSNFLFKWTNRRTNYHPPPVLQIRAKTCSKWASVLHLHRNKSLEIRMSDTNSNLKIHLMNCAVKVVSTLLLVIILAAVNLAWADVLLMVSFVTLLNGIRTMMLAVQIYYVCWKSPLLNLNTLSVIRFANTYFCWICLLPFLLMWLRDWLMPGANLRSVSPYLLQPVLNK